MLIKLYTLLAWTVTEKRDLNMKKSIPLNTYSLLLLLNYIVFFSKQEKLNPS